MALTRHYREKLKDGTLKPDAAQQAVLERLSALSVALNTTPPQKPSLLGKLFRKSALPAPKGLYIHGEVGRGKTMLMDLFHDGVQGWPKRRIHFHAFMQDIHAQRARLGGEDVINRMADELSLSAKLLCLDEMQIVDIADAMIIGRLYEALLARGVVLVTTSNLPPEGLYRDGLNRQLFLPFIARLRDTLDVVSLDSVTDYRLGRVRARETFLHPATAENRVAFNALWKDLTDNAHGSQCAAENRIDRRWHDRRHACASRSAQGTGRHRDLFDIAEGLPQGKALDLAQSGAGRRLRRQALRHQRPMRRSPAPMSASSPPACRASRA
jgi:cell division protein ZapE